MNAKILKNFLVILGFVALFSGCSTKEKVYIDRPVEIKVPQKCDVPEVRCSWDKSISDTKLIEELVICVKNLREAIGVCK